MISSRKAGIPLVKHSKWGLSCRYGNLTPLLILFPKINAINSFGGNKHNFMNYLFFDIECAKSDKGGVRLTVNDAGAKRIEKLLDEKNMTQYRLEQNSEIQHGSLQCIMKGRNKTVTLSTIMMLAKGFGISVVDFLNDDIFELEEPEIEKK